MSVKEFMEDLLSKIQTLENELEKLKENLENDNSKEKSENDNSNEYTEEELEELDKFLNEI